MHDPIDIDKILGSVDVPLVDGGPVQVFDFFSGCGGTSSGFKSINGIDPIFKMIGGCDINADSAASYSLNIGAHGIVDDVFSISEDEASIRAFFAKIPGFNPNQPLVLIGCAPCQGFSAHTKRHKDKEPDIRNGLVARFARIVAVMKPVFAVMENVPELLGKKYIDEFEAFKSIVSEAGMTTDARIFNAAGFGVPQERMRSIVVARPSDIEFEMPEPFLKAAEYRTVRQAISDLPAIASGERTDDVLHICATHRDSTLDVIRQVPHDGGSRPKGVGPQCLDKVKGFSDVYGRMRWDRPSITVTHYARNPASGRFTHPEQDRGMTAREAARLQSFPDSFRFVGAFDSIFRQIGEAVPPLLGAAVGMAIRNAYRKHDSLSAKPAASVSRLPIQHARSGLTAIDAFCGAGGLSIGLRKAGIDVAYGFDSNAEAVKTCNMNQEYLGHSVECARIEDIDAPTLLQRLGLRQGETFLVAGGPPCQGFSEQRRGEDIDARNELVEHYIDFVLAIRPHWFIMENVPGLKNRRGKDKLAAVMDKVEKAGYHPHFGEVDAADHGVPQRRKRVLLIGERLDRGGPTFTFPKAITPKGQRLTVRDAISHLPLPPVDFTNHPDVGNHKREKLTQRNLDRIRAVVGGQGRVDLPPELLAECHKVSADLIGFRKVYGRMAWDDVAPTITARFDSFTRGQFGHPEDDRSVTHREGALLQTFPADYKFSGNKYDVGVQIGNAVPPNLAMAIGRQILACEAMKVDNIPKTA